LINSINRVFIYCFVSLLLAAIACYAYWQEIYFLAISLVLLIAIVLIRYPEYLLYALLLSIPWSVEFNFTPELGTDLPDEPLMLLGALSALFFLVYQWRRNAFKKLHPLVFLLLLQFLWIIISVATSTEVTASVKYLLAKTWYLLAFVALPVFLFKEEKLLKRSAAVLVFSMTAVMVVSLVRHSQYGWSFEKVNDALTPFFRNHVNYSALLVFMVPLQIAMMQLASSKKIRLFLFCILLVTIAAVYFSYARGAWLALILGLFAYWLLKKRLLAFSFLFLLNLVVAMVFWLRTNDRFIQFSNDYKSTIYHSDFREHLAATYQLKDLSNAERIYRWVAGVRMASENWQTGFGPSSFYHQYKSYTLPAFKTYVSKNEEQSTVHNYFLLLLIEQGVIGCFLFITLLAALFWYAQKIYFRTRKRFWKVVVSAVAAVLVMECTVNFLSDMIETDKAGSVFYLCIATLIIADIKTKRSEPSANIESVS
jgi:O-antigen ligase